MSGNQPFSRRRLLQAGLALPTIVPSTALGFGPLPSANDRIQVGVIGLGSRGFNLLDDLLKAPDVAIRMVCDVDRIHYRDREWGTGKPFGIEGAIQKIASARKDSAAVATTSDFREVCHHDEVDAVVVATPDHWHALCTLEALRNGKDVYCEKPVTHTFHEGQLVYREAAKQKAVFQTGSQQRSDAKFQRAVELVRNGLPGQIRRVEVGLPAGYDQPQGETKVIDPPEHLDFDFWSGPAPMMPYMRARHHRWWRGNRAYGGGVLMDWIGHHNDIAHWAMDLDQSGPNKVEAIGWTFPETDVYDTPHHYEIQCEFDGGVTSSIGNRHRLGTKLIGDDGWVFVTRGRIEASDERWTRDDFVPGGSPISESANHMRDFLDRVRDRHPSVAPAETAHRSITPGHLGYVSHTLGRPLRWDPVKERIEGDDEANRLLNASEYRRPWSLDQG